MPSDLMARAIQNSQSRGLDLPSLRPFRHRTPARPAVVPASPDPAAELLFRRWTMPELLQRDRTVKWLARGHTMLPTHGMTAGEMKTMKTYVDIFVNVAVAAGVPIFDQFGVDEATPVIVYVGEGGQIPYTRRLERVASAMGVKLKDIPLFCSFDTAPILSPRFHASLARDLDELRPGRVSIDPFYAFHGTQTDARNLHDEGALLTAVSQPCFEAGAALNICNHFNQTGSGHDLKRISMVGGGEWADSWWLLSHREPPNLDHGQFQLLYEIGSRQWGGSVWDLDLNVGVFDPDTGEFDGPVTWDIRRHAGNGGEGGDRIEAAILEVLRDHPWELTKTQVLEKVGGNRDRARKDFDALEKAGRIRTQRLARPEAGTGKTRDLWAVADEPVPTAGPSSPGA